MFTVSMLSLSLSDSKLMLFVMLVLGAVSLLRCYQAASSQPLPLPGFYALKEGRGGEGLGV